jgi:predicted nucleic-acid-binding Zn-ribbon protein
MLTLKNMTKNFHVQMKNNYVEAKKKSIFDVDEEGYFFKYCWSCKKSEKNKRASGKYFDPNVIGNDVNCT